MGKIVCVEYQSVPLKFHMNISSQNGKICILSKVKILRFVKSKNSMVFWNIPTIAHVIAALVIFKSYYCLYNNESHNKMRKDDSPDTCWHRRHSSITVMTSSNGNIFRVTGHLYGKFIGLRWIAITKASDAELWCFLINGWVNNNEAGDLRRHRAHCDVIVMKNAKWIWKYSYTNHRHM